MSGDAQIACASCYGTGKRYSPRKRLFGPVVEICPDCKGAARVSLTDALRKENRRLSSEAAKAKRESARFYSALLAIKSAPFWRRGKLARQALAGGEE